MARRAIGRMAGNTGTGVVCNPQVAGGIDGNAIGESFGLRERRDRFRCLAGGRIRGGRSEAKDAPTHRVADIAHPARVIERRTD